MKTSLSFRKQFQFRIMFDMIDEDGNGSLEPEEMQRALAAVGLHIDILEVQKRLVLTNSRGVIKFDSVHYCTLTPQPFFFVLQFDNFL